MIPFIVLGSGKPICGLAPLFHQVRFSQQGPEGRVRSFLVHYRAERNHQGLDNRPIDPGEEVGRIGGDVECRQRLGGILRYYHRKAA